jgi:hypothetical protein
VVRGGPSSGLAGLGRTGLSGSSLPIPLGPGPAILHARSPSEKESGTHWRGSPLWAHAANGSPVRLPHWQRTRSLSSLPDASASIQLASGCRRQLLGSQRLIPASPSCCVPRCPGPAAPGPLPPVPAPVSPEDCQSGVSTPKAPSVPQHTLLVPQTRQQLV